MKIIEIAVIRRENGFFHHQGRKIKAYYPRRGYAVMVFLEYSPIDKDFGFPVWVPSVEDLEKIEAALKESDRLTHDLLGRGWDHGPRPYLKVADHVGVTNGEIHVRKERGTDALSSCEKQGS